MLGCICSVELACGSTLASKLSIFRSKAVSWFSIAAAVFSPLSKRICVSLFGSECGREPSVSVIGYWLLVIGCAEGDTRSKMVCMKNAILC